MAARSKVKTLPDAIRDELDRRLVAMGFGGYDDLAAWLTEAGYEISRSAVHRYGQKFEERLAAIKLASQQATAIAEAVGDDEGRLGDALTQLVQQKAFDTLVEMEDVGKVSLTSLGLMVAKLNATGVQQKKFIAEMREKARAVADDVAALAKAGGLTDTAADAIRAKILGLAS